MRRPRVLYVPTGHAITSHVKSPFTPLPFTRSFSQSCRGTEPSKRLPARLSLVRGANCSSCGIVPPMLFDEMSSWPKCCNSPTSKGNVPFRIMLASIKLVHDQSSHRRSPLTKSSTGPKHQSTLRYEATELRPVARYRSVSS